jgi:hypothetical protein
MNGPSELSAEPFFLESLGDDCRAARVGQECVRSAWFDDVNGRVATIIMVERVMSLGLPIVSGDRFVSDSPLCPFVPCGLNAVVVKDGTV